jgi:NADH:ubiquinone oxidoreductase subunit 3 (subunit A)
MEGAAEVRSTASMNPYVPVAIYLCVALAAALLFTVLPGLVARRKPNPQKLEAYECGVEPTSAVSGRFPVRFYLIAMLFVIFDVEAASFYPWAVQMHALRVFGLLEMIVFIVVLAIGYAYVWKKGGFVWR